MKNETNTENIKKYNIVLLDCQIELMLKSLEFYAYTYHYIYPKKEAETDEENSRRALVTDTYHQILAEYNESKTKNQIEPNLKFLDFDENKNKKDQKIA